MRRFKSCKRILAVALTLMMVFSMIPSLTPAVYAAGTEQDDFPLYAKNGDLVADKDTRYVTTFVQNPETKLITATVEVQNNSKGNDGITINGIGVEISFTDQVAPYAYDPKEPANVDPADQSRMYFGSGTKDRNVIRKYCQTPIESFSTLGSVWISNDGTQKIVGTKISAANDTGTITVASGKSVTIAQFYFMPTNGKDDLDLKMFHYQWESEGMNKLTTWLGNGSCLVISNEGFPSAGQIYIVSPSTFKLHVQHPTPMNLEAGEEEGIRKIVGYDKETMEWSVNGEDFENGEPVIDNGTQTIYVRVKGDDTYSGSDVEYGDYKKYLPSEAVAVAFDAKETIDVTYKAGLGATGDDHIVRVEEGTEHVVLGNEETKFERQDYYLSAWNTEENGTGIVYQVGDKIKIMSPITLYAQWEEGTPDLGSPEPVAEKSSENLTRRDGKNYIGDVLEYTIIVGNTGTGDWNNVVITDVLPKELTMTKGVKIDGEDTLDYKVENDTETQTMTLEVSLGTIKPGMEKKVTFEAIINADAKIGSNVKNSAIINGKDGDGEDVDKDVTESDGGREIEKPEEENGFFAVKTSRNTTSKDEKTRVGDTIEYIITAGNNSEVKEEETFEVTYKAGIDGEGDDHTDEVKAGVEYTILGNDELETPFKKDNSKFNGWNTEEDGTGVSYAAEEIIQVTENLTLHAQWEEEVETDPEGEETEVDPTEPEDANTEGAIGEETATGEESGQETVVDEGSDDEAITEESEDEDVTEEESDENSLTEETSNQENTIQQESDDDQVKKDEASVEVNTPNEDTSSSNEESVTESNEGTSEQTEANMVSMLKGSMFSIVNRALYDNSSVRVIRMDGADGVWNNVVVTDELPAHVTFIDGSVKINGQKTEKYSYENRKLTVDLENIAAGEMVVVTFEVTIDDDAAGKTIKNLATVSGQDGDGEVIDKETEEPDGGREVEEAKNRITITYNAGSGTGSDKEVTVEAGAEHKALTIANAEMSKEGYSFVSWNIKSDGTGTAYKAGAVVPTDANITLYAQWSKNNGGGATGSGGGGKTTIKDDKTPLGLNKEDHIAYVKGYPEGDFRSEKPITRAEAAQLFYNLLIGVKKTGYSSQFGDVNAGAWYADAVNCLSANNIILGYPDGSFKPNSYITRAEFATLSSKFDKLSASDTNRFNDVNDSHWAVSYINSAAVKGWIKGYENGEFRPARNITRAEVVTLVNAILERKVSAGDILKEAKTFNDLATSHWAYCDIMEAANEHTYSRKEDGIHEIWHEIVH